MIPLVPCVRIVGLKEKRAVGQNYAHTVLISGIPSSDGVLPDVRHAVVQYGLMKKSCRLGKKRRSKILKKIKITNYIFEDSKDLGSRPTHYPSISFGHYFWEQSRLLLRGKRTL